MPQPDATEPVSIGLHSDAPDRLSAPSRTRTEDPLIKRHTTAPAYGPSKTFGTHDLRAAGCCDNPGEPQHFFSVFLGHYPQPGGTGRYTTVRRGGG